MVISAIERQKRRPERVNIFIDGVFALGIHESVLLKSGYRKGDVVDEQALRVLEATEEYNAAKEKALRLISYRMRSEKELTKRLTDKGFLPEVIGNVLTNLRENNLLDDRKFAFAFVHDTILRKKAGRTLLQRELRLKGVAPEIIESVLAESIDTAEEEERAVAAAKTVLQRYVSSRKQSDQLKQRQRLTSFLARRGYDFAIIGRVMKRLFSPGNSDQTDNDDNSGNEE